MDEPPATASLAIATLGVVIFSAAVWLWVTAVDLNEFDRDRLYTCAIVEKLSGDAMRLYQEGKSKEYIEARLAQTELTTEFMHKLLADVTEQTVAPTGMRNKTVRDFQAKWVGVCNYVFDQRETNKVQ